MKILLLTLQRISTVSARGIYRDLMRKFRDEGHEVYIATPAERRYKEKTGLIEADGVSILRIRSLNITQTHFLEKGLATVLIEFKFLSAVKKNFSEVNFDLILYSTPPITFTRVIKYIKNKDNSLSYLLLKDIFPQNAVDLGLFKKNGLLHKYFRKREKELYAVSDYIGCMSPANVDFIRRNNPQIDPEIVEVNPNSMDPIDSFIDEEQRISVRQKYHIPEEAVVFMYGGNLGKPQGIPFFIDVLDHQKENTDIFFIVAGSGTEYSRIQSWFKTNNPSNALLLPALSKNEFDLLVQACDAGLIFLDKRFTIPNFPSRLLNYLECKLPVIAATDINTDLGSVIEKNNFGLWTEAGDLQGINKNIEILSENSALRKKMGQAGYEYMKQNFTVLNSYQTIIRHFNKNDYRG